MPPNSKHTGRGGRRAGSGRPKGTGKYNETTQVVRIPSSLVPQIEDIIDHYKHSFSKQYHALNRVPLYSDKVAAGSPALADDHVDEYVNLNEYLMDNPEATFLVRASGNSMINAGIFHDDLLVVDKSLPPEDGKIVIAAINGEMTVKRLQLKNKVPILLPENPDYNPIKISPEDDFSIAGIVTQVIHSV